MKDLLMWIIVTLGLVFFIVLTAIAIFLQGMANGGL